MSQFLGLGSPTQNHLLLALCGEERSRLVLKLQSVALSLGQVLHEPGGRLEYIYFPTSSVISFVYTMRDGSTAEMGLVGNEGVLGIAIFLGGESTCSRAQVALAGHALRMSAKLLQKEFARDAQLRRPNPP